MIYNTIYRTDGISDSDRLSNPLIVNPFRIHDLCREEFITCSKYYGRNILFFDRENKPAGTWADCFGGDEITVLSDIKCFEISAFVKNSRILLGSSRAVSSFSEIVDNALKVVAKIDSWYISLLGIDSHIANVAAHTIGNLISENSENLLADISEIVRGNSRDNKKFRIPRLSAIWRMERIEEQRPQIMGDKVILCRNMIVGLQSLVMSIKKNTAVFINESLERNDHSPETAMFLAFLGLLQSVQTEINSIPGRYVQFYYEKILQFGLKKTESGNVYVNIVPNSSLKEDVIIPPGTEFNAEYGEISGKFENVNEIIVRNCQINSIYTMCLLHDKFSEPEKTIGLYSGIEITDCSKKKAENNADVIFPVFGGAVNNKISGSGGCAAKCGWAIASKILFMTEGERNVKIQLWMNNNLYEHWDIEFRKQLAEGIAVYTDEENKAGLVSYFNKILNSLLVVELTTDNGWYKTLQYSANIQNGESIQDNNIITIEFTIPVNAPAITAYNESIHGSGFCTDLPVCRFTFNNDAEIYPYSLLRKLSLNSIHLDVSVKNAADLHLYNQYGALDTKTPFMPFGPMPSRGDYLVIGNYEMANKNVDMIDIDIRWANVPWQENGFSDYYANYSTHFDNNCFRVSLSELKEGQWITCENETCTRMTLFESERKDRNGEGTGRIKNARKFSNIPLHCMREKNIMSERNSYEYTCKAKDGFLRLELTEPVFGFGNMLYTTETASAMISQILSRKKTAVPQQPFIPVVNEIRINYHAHSSINFSHVFPPETDYCKMDTFFHIYPFGSHHLYPVNDIESVTLIPEIDKAGNRYNMNGNLLIGLSGNKPEGMLSLHIRMAEERLIKKESKVIWSYLKSDRWVEIEPRRIAIDTTCNMAVTGIINIFLPSDIGNTQSLMPDGLYWLRASTADDIDSFGSIISINVNGAKLTEKIDCGEKKCSQGFPDGSISSLVATIPGVDGVVQHGSSFGRRECESEGKYLTRISERLRHKNRVVSCYDYEHIIMEEFPLIMKAKCFPNMLSGDTKYMHPGHVLIAVVAMPVNCGSGFSQCPKVNGEQLKNIENHLRKISAPSAKIEVINPVYEEIQLRCAIVLKRNTSHVNAVYNVNKAVSDYISPWNNTGNISCFGWKIKLPEIEQFLRSLPQVDHVTDFSMLQKTENETRKYSLFDSAVNKDDKLNERCIYPQIPWSICIPFRFHAIEIIDEVENRKPDITGISKADIGNILIVKGKNGYGTAEQENA